MKIKVYSDGVLKEEILAEGFLNSVTVDGCGPINIFVIGWEGSEVLAPYTVKELELADGKVLKFRMSHSAIFDEAIEILKDFPCMNYCECELDTVKVEIQC